MILARNTLACVFPLRLLNLAKAQPQQVAQAVVLTAMNHPVITWRSASDTPGAAVSPRGSPSIISRSSGIKSRNAVVPRHSGVAVTELVQNRGRHEGRDCPLGLTSAVTHVHGRVCPCRD